MQLTNVDIDNARVIISVPAKSLLETLNFLKRAIPRTKKSRDYLCELTVKTNQVDFVVIGASKTLYCKTNGPVKATVLFSTLYDLVKNIREHHALILITDQFLRIGVTTIQARTFFFHDDSILRSINLPINYLARDVLLLAEHYTEEEIEFNGLTEKLNLARRELIRDMALTYERLKNYGFSRSETEDMIIRKIYL